MNFYSHTNRANGCMKKRKYEEAEKEKEDEGNLTRRG
jgi:hypothetical protein